MTVAIVIIASVLNLILLVWALVDIVKNKPEMPAVWVMLGLLFPVIRPIIYFQWKYWSRRERR